MIGPTLAQIQVMARTAPKPGRGVNHTEKYMCTQKSWPLWVTGVRGGAGPLRRVLQKGLGHTTYGVPNGSKKDTRCKASPSTTSAVASGSHAEWEQSLGRCALITRHVDANGLAQVLQQPQGAQGKPGQLLLRAAQPLNGGGGGDDQATPSAKAETGAATPTTASKRRRNVVFGLGFWSITDQGFQLKEAHQHRRGSRADTTCRSWFPIGTISQQDALTSKNRLALGYCAEPRCPCQELLALVHGLFAHPQREDGDETGEQIQLQRGAGAPLGSLC